VQLDKKYEACLILHNIKGVSHLFDIVDAPFNSALTRRLVSIVQRDLRIELKRTLYRFTANTFYNSLSTTQMSTFIQHQILMS
jgi:hypothetical protein